MPLVVACGEWRLNRVGLLVAPFALVWSSGNRPFRRRAPVMLELPWLAIVLADRDGLVIVRLGSGNGLAMGSLETIRRMEWLGPTHRHVPHLVVRRAAE